MTWFEIGDALLHISTPDHTWLPAPWELSQKGRDLPAEKWQLPPGVRQGV